VIIPKFQSTKLAESIVKQLIYSKQVG